MSVYLRGNRYWCNFYVDGIRYFKSTGTSNFREATKVEQRLKDEINRKRHQITEPHPEMTVVELWIRFRAEGDCKLWHIDRMKVVLPYWGTVPIGRIHKAMAADYRKRRHAEKPITESTINRDLEALRHILFWAVDEGLLAANPLGRLRMVPERRKPRSILGLGDERELLDAAAPHLRNIIITALDTGMRRGELTHQCWGHVDFNRNVLSVTQSKTAGGESREIPLTKRVSALLQTMRQEQGLLFTFKGKPIRIIKTAWKAAVRRAGIRYLRFHDLRHTFNTRLMEAGVMQEVRKTLMGHSSGEDINATYTHVEFPAKREAIRKLEAWVATQTIQPKSQGGTHDSTKANRSSTGQILSFPGRKKTVEKKDPGRSRA